MNLANRLHNTKIWLATEFMVLAVGLLLAPVLVFAAGGAYSDGAYSACTYNSCGITLTSNGTTNVNVIVGSSTTCTTQSDSVGVTTDSSTGYTVTLNDSTTSSSLTGSGAATIPTTASSQGSPSALIDKTWGYRVDGVGSFGSGPTSASSNVSPSSTTFAGIPTSLATGDTIAYSVSPADPTVTTTVWYSVCADSTVPADTYTSTVVYTALVN